MKSRNQESDYKIKPPHRPESNMTADKAGKPIGEYEGMKSHRTWFLYKGNLSTQVNFEPFRDNRRPVFFFRQVPYVDDDR